MVEKEARVSSREGNRAKIRMREREYEKEEVQDVRASRNLEELKPRAAGNRGVRRKPRGREVCG
jgi:hypothetical protein